MLFQPFTDSRFLAPFQALRSMRDQLERLVAEQGLGRSTSMAFALYTKDDALLLRTPLPGLEARDVALEIDGNSVTLSGQWPGEPDGESAEAQHVERPSGTFSRTLRLPFEVDAANVKARLERGVLEVEIPRVKKTPPVKIQVLNEAKRN